MKRFLLGYALGVASAPVVYYFGRKPIIEHILVPILTDEKMDASLYKIMMARNDIKDAKKKQEEK